MRIAATDNHGALNSKRALRGGMVDEVRLGEIQFQTRFKYSSAAAASTVVRTALSSGSGDNVTAQVIMFGWRASEGEEAKKKRAAAKLAEQELARKPKEAVKVVEDDLDMFS